ncbi:hypothetical protein LLH06_00470 [Mucilaginibacter daejeonensis]|uniref:hypothetical protein n=1 Tax=Mucilaginibacter daejeonensis TaxID=398049 RepID=UPI001D171E2D|nr:hypothetical protein [Mucilaginibacter daejeonensis]UEG53451.1 hypothetical protein LLH06_00470 [Mucilaginibacter daejeonensis]
MASIKRYDLSKLWRADAIVTHGSDDIIETEPFPEPLGYIGTDHQRFYIHYTSVRKDTSDPYKYLVQGKTRVKDHICNIKGTITIVKAQLFKGSDDPRYRQGEVVCKVELKEDSAQKHSGMIKGQMISNWCLDKRDNLLYDAINFVADGYCNNQCTAVWTSYTTHQSKICNWGDFRMPNSEQLDTGVGDVYINERFIKNGWQNYVKAYSGDRREAKRAIAEEERKWWK